MKKKPRRRRKVPLLPFLRRVPRNARVTCWDIVCDEPPPRELGNINDRRRAKAR